MYAEAKESYVHKFDSPFTAWLYDQSGNGCLDDETGSVEWSGWYGRMGRRVLVEDSQGFVSSTRFATETAAQECLDAISAEYAEWDDQD